MADDGPALARGWVDASCLWLLSGEIVYYIFLCTLDKSQITTEKHLKGSSNIACIRISRISKSVSIMDPRPHITQNRRIQIHRTWMQLLQICTGMLVSMVQRVRRWLNFVPKLGERFVFDENPL